MNVKNTETEKGQAKIQVELGAVEFENALSKAYAKAKKNIAIPGFRKGKAPRKIVEAMYGSEIFYEDAIEEIFPDVYKTAVLDQKIKAVGRPSVAAMEKTEEGGLLLTIATDLYPEVTLGQYKGLEVEKAEATVSDEEVESEIDKMVEQSARISTVERPAQMGDTAVIDFEGFVDGKPFDGGKGENYSLKLGSGSFIPGFEDQLVGLSAGDSKDVVVTFPEQYTPELAGKEATFKCSVHEVKESILPEKDDEFAKDASEFDTLEELRADVRSSKLAEKQKEIDNAFENACVAKAVENMSVEIPESMVEEQTDREIDNFRYQVERNGMSMDDYVRMLGGDEASLRKTFRPAAENNVKAQLLLSQIIVEEKIEVSEEEIEAEYSKVAEQYKMEVDKVKEVLQAESVRTDLSSRKAVELITASAIPVAPKAEEPEAPAAEE